MRKIEEGRSREGSEISAETTQRASMHKLTKHIKEFFTLHFFGLFNGPVLRKIHFINVFYQVYVSLACQ